jgi:hypothetical protein
MERRMFFFEKKNQKTFAIWDRAQGQRGAKKSKVFCFFFSKKKTFLADPPARIATRSAGQRHPIANHAVAQTPPPARRPRRPPIVDDEAFWGQNRQANVQNA